MLVGHEHEIALWGTTREWEWPIHLVLGDLSSDVSPFTTAANLLEGGRRDEGDEDIAHESCDADVLTSEQRAALLEDLRERVPPQYRDWDFHVVTGCVSPDDAPATTAASPREERQSDAEDATDGSCAEVLAEIEGLMAQLDERFPSGAGTGDRIFAAIGGGASQHNYGFRHP